MAYVHHYRDTPMLSSAGAYFMDLSTGIATNQLHRFAPGYQPVQVIAVGLELLTSTALVTKPTVRFYYSSAAGSTSANWTSLATFTLTSSAQTTPIQYYKDSINQIVRPGTELVARVDTTATQSCLAIPTFYYYPLRQDPAQNSAMLASG